MRCIVTVDPSASLPVVETVLVAEGATVVDRREQRHLLIIEVVEGQIKCLSKVAGIRDLSPEGTLWARPSVAPGSSWRSLLWETAGFLGPKEEASEGSGRQEAVATREPWG